jgi:hypothetical protein
MFVNLTQIPFTKEMLNSYKFRLLLLCPELTAQDLAEENDDYEGYRTFLFSKVKKEIFFVIVDLMAGNIPKICELSNNGDRLLNYEETKLFLTNQIVYRARNPKRLDINISPEHQKIIENGISEAVRKALLENMNFAKISHYEDTEEDNFEFCMWLHADTLLMKKAIYESTDYDRKSE